MPHERLGAFNDAVLAIVMTIIVLEFEVPDPLTAQTLTGIVLSATVFPPAMVCSVLLTLCCIVIPHQLRG